MAISKLIVVDDEKAFCRFIRRAAERSGFEVTVVDNAKEFLSALDSNPPDVVVMDIIMPDMDGIELIKHLSKKNCTAAIIVISGYDGVYLENAKKLAVAGNLNVVNALTKPVHLQTISMALKQALLERKSSAA